jgi:hypothetical protein
MDARVSNSLWNNGLGYVAIARRGRHNQVAAAIFLVDVYCLGVKDIILLVDSEARWREYLHGVSGTVQGWTEVAPEHARKLVEGAVAYARSFDLQPHRDWPTAALIFGDVDASQCLAEFTFGKDGKPFFIGGPNDTPARVTQIMQTLARTAGPDRFHFLTPIDERDLPPELVRIVERGDVIGIESDGNDEDE